MNSDYELIAMVSVLAPVCLLAVYLIHFNISIRSLTNQPFKILRICWSLFLNGLAFYFLILEFVTDTSALALTLGTFAYAGSHWIILAALKEESEEESV